MTPAFVLLSCCHVVARTHIRSSAAVASRWALPSVVDDPKGEPTALSLRAHMVLYPIHLSFTSHRSDVYNLSNHATASCLDGRVIPPSRAVR